MTPYKSELDYSLLTFGDEGGSVDFTLRNAYESILILGALGSGKSSSSARLISIKMLKAGFGGLILTAKDEVDTWKEYCKETGRLDDLLIVSPGGNHNFDFLKYLSSHNNAGTKHTSNILQVLKTVIRQSDEKSGSLSSDPFWEKSLDLLLGHLLQLSALAFDEISVPKLYEILLTLPKTEDHQINQKDKKVSAFEEAFTKARDKVLGEVDKWYDAQSLEKIAELKFSDTYETTLLNAVPNARTMKYLDLFFFETFKNLSSKTKSIIEFTCLEFFYSLLQEPFYSIFCKNEITVKPEDCLDGKIILLNIPVKHYHKVGRDCQVLFKYIFQLEMEKRNVKQNDRPIFLISDECQFFLHEHDAVFQSTARSVCISSIYITQNLSNLYAVMGGNKPEDRVKALLGVFGTKIYHANTHIETNQWASALIGDALFLDPARSITTAKEFSQNDSVSLKLERRVRPEEFVGLTTGGSRNNYRCEAYIHVQGDKLFNNENFKKVKFNQNHN